MHQKVHQVQKKNQQKQQQKNRFMKIICGLGNYGDKYHHNRHNIGFLTIDYLKEEYNFPQYKNGYKALYTIGKIKGEKVLL